MKRTLLALTLAAPVLALSAAAPAFADSGSAATMYHATLDAQNHQNASGTLTLTLNGNSATIDEHTMGLASTFSGSPFPHVQHIHGGAAGTCPTAAADKNGDGVVSTTEGAPSYGAILTTLSVAPGGTTPADGTNIKIAPAGSSYDYHRTITLDSQTMAAIRGGTAVIVVHGDDPTLLSKKAQGEKSELPGTTSLPLAATAPALCGTLVAMPMGGASTGGGSTAGTQDAGLFAVGGLALLGAAGTFAYRRRSTQAS